MIVIWNQLYENKILEIFSESEKNKLCWIRQQLFAEALSILN